MQVRMDINQITEREMFMQKVKRFAGRLLFISILFPCAIASQITVKINSGNPAFPFPQFLAYANHSEQLGNLATRNPDGVTHAEMEKTIREAYQIMMNRASKPGSGVGGKDYIKFRSSPQTSEGDGYALLAAAAMADKETFDGLWLYIHDSTMNKVKRYSDCKESSPGYAYSHLPGWLRAGVNSATDGDEDIGFALLCAYLQWGEFMGIDDACGEPISYKKEAIEFLKGLTDTVVMGVSGGYISGDIGLDGYIKGGDSWSELTSWANDTTQSGLPRTPDMKGPEEQNIDYAAPSYYHAFAEFLTKTDPALYLWNIRQFARAEASSDWLMGQMLTDEKMIPFAGKVALSSTNVPEFNNFSDGEDFRLAWRTVLNNVWYGNPSYSWDPVKHEPRSDHLNSYERDIGKRYAKFLWDSRQAPWNNPGSANVGGEKSTLFWGTEVLKYYYSTTGEAHGSFLLNWVPGTGSPSAVVSQDFNLMAELYRTLEINWDSENEERYLKSIPHYFHEWFRLMGMLTLTGNYQSPSAIKASANMKVYLDVDKTSVFKDDTIMYTISYRNYGSVDAQDVTIIDTLDRDFTYASSTGGGIFDASSRTVKWNIGIVPGFKSTSGIDPTKGEIVLKVTIANPTRKQYANTASIKCSNGSGWTSNEYPNLVSTIMKRNLVDIISKPPTGEVNVSDITALHGGRPGVRFSYLQTSKAASSSMQTIAVHLIHDAQEPYINNGNYRVSYFLYDTERKGIHGQNGNTNGWVVNPIIKEGISNIAISHENLTPGSDSHGKWNQRIIIQFSDTLPNDTSWKDVATTYWHLQWYKGNPGMIHRGGLDPLRLVCTIAAADNANVKWDDDYSWCPNATAAQDYTGFPVTPDFTDPSPDNPGVAVNSLHPKMCTVSDTTVDNILVEEWDGTTWRRVFGNALNTSVSINSTPTKTVARMSMQLKNNSVIRYSLSNAGPVHLQVLDLKGSVIATLVDKYNKAGNYTVRWNHDRFGSNVYFLRMVTGNGSLIQKLTSIN